MCQTLKIVPAGLDAFTIAAECATMQSVITALLYHGIVIEGYGWEAQWM